MSEETEVNPELNMKKFGTFTGVFIPTLLTILGLIMFLRLGWVVGNVGLLGTIIIIALAFFITITTALSMSSIVTNMRIGSGGAYSIITRSLGLEVGGSLGIPLYLALAFSTAMYIFGFREGVLWLYPDISPLLVDFATFAILFLVALLSTEIAFKIQYVILVIIIGSLVSVLASGIGSAPALEIHAPQSGLTFLIIFAVFFPAATGIMAGANMSGELKDPRVSIPKGTLAAIMVSLVIYIVLAFWLAGNASQTELVNNYTVLIDGARWREVALAGLFVATLSSALNSMVGASRICHAMGENNILPRSKWFSKRSKSGEPRNAILFTGLIVVGALLLRELNTIAPLITLFFLITYMMINLVILIEQSLGLISFRPLLKLPTFVPVAGTVSCTFVMFIISPVFSLIAVFVVVVIYYLLMHRHLEDSSPYGDVRSGLFVALAEWAAKKSKSLKHSSERAWKANLLVPVEDPTELKEELDIIEDITYPRGSVSVLGINLSEESLWLEAQLAAMCENFREREIFTNWTVVEAGDYAEDTIVSIQTLKGRFFSPNIIFLSLKKDKEREESLKKIIREAPKNKIGFLLFLNHPKMGLGRRRSINLWIPYEYTELHSTLKLPNCDLAILVAIKLTRNWHGELNILTKIDNNENEADAKENLLKLARMARIPFTNINVFQNEGNNLEMAPSADINILCFSEELEFNTMRKMVDEARSACLFCQDSGNESALM